MHIYNVQIIICFSCYGSNGLPVDSGNILSAFVVVFCWLRHARLFFNVYSHKLSMHQHPHQVISPPLLNFGNSSELILNKKINLIHFLTLPHKNMKL